MPAGLTHHPSKMFLLQSASALSYFHALGSQSPEHLPSSQVMAALSTDISLATAFPSKFPTRSSPDALDRLPDLPSDPRPSPLANTHQLLCHSPPRLSPGTCIQPIVRSIHMCLPHYIVMVLDTSDHLLICVYVWRCHSEGGWQILFK